jgi:hypothetical protein
VENFTCSLYIACLSLSHLDSTKILPSLIRVLRLFFFVLFSRPIIPYPYVHFYLCFVGRKGLLFFGLVILLDPSQKSFCLMYFKVAVFFLFFLCFFQQKTPSFIGLRHLLILKVFHSLVVKMSFRYLLDIFAQFYQSLHYFCVFHFRRSQRESRISTMRTIYATNSTVIPRPTSPPQHNSNSTCTSCTPFYNINIRTTWPGWPLDV